MRYLLLICNRDEQWLSPSPDEQPAMLQQYREFTQSVQASGRMQGGYALEASSTATTLRVRDGKVLTTDGPFAETKEQLVGYYVVDANDLDEALAIAARIPGARWGAVEVRPVRVMGGG
ncbi:MAG: YciI family protein [Candidatus Rokubacteria bacterium]|nr:YciI family protein [Candidatus Rokubacteria bacterium]